MLAYSEECVKISKEVMTYKIGLVMKMSHLMQNLCGVINQQSECKFQYRITKQQHFRRLTNIKILELEFFQKFLLRVSLQLKHQIPNINRHFKLVQQRHRHLTNFTKQSQYSESADRTVLCRVQLAAQAKKILMLSDKFFHCKI